MNDLRQFGKMLAESRAYDRFSDKYLDFKVYEKKEPGSYPKILVEFENIRHTGTVDLVFIHDEKFLTSISNPLSVFKGDTIIVNWSDYQARSILEEYYKRVGDKYTPRPVDTESYKKRIR